MRLPVFCPRHPRGERTKVLALSHAAASPVFLARLPRPLRAGMIVAAQHIRRHGREETIRGDNHGFIDYVGFV
jgi:hypothetical protein